MPDVAVAIAAGSSPLTVALRVEGGPVTLAVAEPGHSADDLTAVIAAAFRAKGLQPSDLCEVRLDLGPGSYTGLRVAVTFARIAAGFRDVEVLSTTSLQLMAHAAWTAGAVPPHTAIRPVLDARRQRFHHALVRRSPRAELCEPPRASTVEELHASVGGSEVLLATAELSASFAGLDNPVLPPPAWDARLLFDDDAGLRPTSAERLDPLYLMASYAE